MDLVNKQIRDAHIRGSSSMIKNLDKEFKLGKVEQCIKEHFSMIKEKVMEKCTGLIVRTIRGIGKKECKMEKEN